MGEDKLNLLDAAKPYIRFIALPYGVATIVLLILAAIFGSSCPLLTKELVVPEALVLTPTLWVGVFLYVALNRYQQSAARLSFADLEATLHAPQRSLKLLESAYQRRESIARTVFRNSVFVAYVMMRWTLELRVTSHGLNPYNDALEEQRDQQRRRTSEAFMRLSELTYTIAAEPSITKANSAKLVSFIASLQLGPAAKQSKLAVKAVLSDGSGFLSTLTLITYLHYISALPITVRTRICAAIYRIPFDAQLLGWVSGRVIECVVYRMIHHGESEDETVELLSLIVSEICADLNSAGIGSAKLAAQYRGRARLRAAAGLPEKT